MKKIILIVNMTALAFLIAACGDMKKNPLEGYDQGVPPYERVENKNEPYKGFFSIYPIDGLNFIEGEKRSVRINVNVIYPRPQEVKYSLRLENAGLMSNGSYSLKKEDGNDSTWLLTWMPPTRIADNLTGVTEFKIKMEFVLHNSSSASARQDFKGQGQFSDDLSVTVLKDSDHPQIESVEGVNPETVVAKNGKAKVDIIVSAKNINNKNINDLQINPIFGPESIKRELHQLDAFLGIGAQANCVDTNKLKEGRHLLRCSYTFNARRFVATAIENLEQDKLLKSRYESGEITTVEAQFSVTALNTNNSRSSGEKLINFKVKLPKAQAADEQAPANVKGESAT